MLLISWHQLSSPSVLRNLWEACPSLNRKRGVVDGGDKEGRWGEELGEKEEGKTMVRM